MDTYLVGSNELAMERVGLIVHTYTPTHLKAPQSVPIHPVMDRA